MTPNQFLVLYGIKKSLSLPLPKYKEEIEHLKNLNYLSKDGTINTEGKKIIVRFENYFVKAKKRTNIQLMGKEFNKRIEEYRNIFPAGKLPSGKPARVNVRSLENSFRWFFENYEVTWDEVIDATKMYVNEYRDKEYMYMKTSQYFVVKTDKNKVKTSDLMDYVDMIKDGVELDDNHFKENVV
jgi:hypothetical protein